MARGLKHPKSGIYWLRKRVPDDLLAAVGLEVVSRVSARCFAPAPTCSAALLIRRPPDSRRRGSILARILLVLANFLSLKRSHGYPSAETMHIFKPMSSRAIGATVGEAVGR